MLHLQEKSCLYKKILCLQENLAKARNLYICDKILQKQEYLSTECKGAIAVLFTCFHFVDFWLNGHRYQQGVIPFFPREHSN